MANLLKIREICSEKKISLVSLSKKLGISQTGMQRILNDNTTKLDTLEKIASILEVPIWVFFDLEPESVFRSDIERLKKENEELKNSVAFFNQKVIDLEKTIEVQNNITWKQSEINEEKEKRIVEKERLIEEKERTIKSYSTMLELYQSLVPGLSNDKKKKGEKS